MMAMTAVSNVFICGAHSVGKTTLVNELVKDATFSSFQRIPEVARRIIKEKGWTRQDFDLGENPENFKLLNVSILQEYQKILAANEKSNALFDRGPDALVYIRYYLGEEEYQKAIETEYVQYCIERFRNGILFILEPHEELIVDDSVRLISTIDELWRYTKLMYKTLDELDIPYIVIKDMDLKRRVETAIEHVRNIHPGD